MKHELHLAADLGTYLAEGARAAEYRLRHLETVFAVYDTITLDFTGIRGINSSFANALLVPLFVQHGIEPRRKLRFRGCNPVVKLMIESALKLGMESAQGQGGYTYA
jgi:hypothetical protein